MQNFLPETQW